MEQYTIFDMIYEPYKINKPIRLIELFAGIGSQAKALENLKVNFEHWKICEWAIPSILAYNEIHQDYLNGYGVDYSKDKTKEELIDYLFNLGISSNYNEPMKLEQIKRQSEDKLRNIYNAIKSENNLVNISTTKGEDLEIIDTDKYDYIVTYSFPCQDLSLAGKRKGMSKEGETRSGLLWQVERLLKECTELPQILLMENVPQVIGEKNIKDFQEWQHFLERLGYKNYVEVLNAKDYEIPQNRQRAFMVSILGNYVYNFPQKKKLKLRLKDMLEDNAANKYYLSDKMVKYLTVQKNNWEGSKGKQLINKEIASALNTGEGTRRCDASNFDLKDTDKLIQDGTLSGGKRDKINESCRRVYDPEGLAPTLHTCNGGNTEPKIIEKPTIAIPEATKKGYAEAHDGDGVYINRPHQKRGVVQKGMIQTLKTSPDCGVVVAAAMRGRGEKPKQQIEVSNREYANAITTVQKDSLVTNNLMIRKLTPKECYRLMGFSDLDCERANKVISDSMIYHTAGDSIVVNVLMSIFKMFF